MKIRIISLLSVVLLMASACDKDRVTGSGSVKTEERAVEYFTKVEIHGSGEVTVHKGTAFKVEVTGYENLLPYFETRVAGGKLTVGYKTIEQAEAVNFSADISGSGKINAFGLTAKNADVEIAGSGEVRTSASDKLDVEISGSGKVYYKGSPAVSTKINGSGAVVKQ